ncbi:MAG TPA: CoA transferase [Jatrophihabitans sp.]|nr:CoA transferase [Jatrophihabitans sp.]
MSADAVGDRFPLDGVRVLDLTDGVGAMCGRLLADLGADVVLVEPPGGAGARSAAPVVDGVSLPFLTQNVNKRLLRIDWSAPAGRDELLTLVRDADILIESQPPGRMAAAGLGVDALHAANPRLVITSVTDFGQTGPYRDWAGTDAVHLALSSVLSRSGQPGREPLLPPGRLAAEHAAAQATWATLVAYWSALETGRGEHVDVSLFEATLQSLDAAWGMGGTATGGMPASDLPPGRPDVSYLYPIFPCADGHVRICMLAKRQWRAMFGWLGEPAAFADPKYDMNAARYTDRDRLYPLIAGLFADGKHADLVEEGQRRGIAIEAVKPASEVLLDEHLNARAAFVDIRLPSGRAGRMPHGMVEIDGRRAGYRAALDESGAIPGFRPRQALPDTPARAARTDDPGPLAGLRVLDLGIIVVGGETGRLFADLGADVIKVETSAFPDGARAASAPGTVSPTFAWGHRNKRSLGIDLRNPKGRQLFLRLVVDSDVVLSNFKPGTMDSLGLGYDELRAANPAVVAVDSSALGRTGPASRRLGYGPLVRAGSGLTSLWRYPDDPEGFCDAITIYPDHTGARVGASAALAALIAARASGRGAAVSIAQVEVMLSQFGAEFLRESVDPGTLVAVGNSNEFDAPCGVYPCAGEDQWCVVSVRHPDDWHRLCAAIGADDLAADPALDTPAGRVARRESIDDRVRAWTSSRDAREVMTTLQNAGVPAGAMARVPELLTDPQLDARDFFATMHQPQLGDLPSEARPARFDRIRLSAPRAAPLHGAQTRQIAREVLHLADAEIQQLIDDGVLEETVTDHRPLTRHEERA